MSRISIGRSVGRPSIFIPMRNERFPMDPFVLSDVLLMNIRPSDPCK